MKIDHEIFTKVILKSLAGSLIGIITGAILGLLIWALQIPLNSINELFGPSSSHLNEMMYGAQNLWPNASFPESLGMAFGAIIGAITGAQVALAKFKK